MFGSKCALSAFTKQTWVHALSFPANCRLQQADTRCYVRIAGLLKLAGAGKKIFSKHLQVALLHKSWSHLFFLCVCLLNILLSVSAPPLIPMVWRIRQVLALAAVVEHGSQTSLPYTHARKKHNLRTCAATETYTHARTHTVTRTELPWLISYLLAATGWVLRSTLCQ